MSDSTDNGENELLSRVRLIEDQPLEARAEAFAQIHEQLQAVLESSDHSR